ncbi:MAG: TlpA disulfide reductase family protein [Proteobacteria bacterium]|nr:TlpA disulfide reductase family protein [Pseudomonadota bacterium]
MVEKNLVSQLKIILPTALLFIATMLGCVFLWISVSRGPLGGSDAPWQDSFGKLAAKHFRLEILFAPDELSYLKTTTLSDQKPHVSLQDLRGKITVINFWASWCDSCAEESPLLESLWQTYKQDNFVVMGVVLHDDPVYAKEHAKKSGKTYLIAYDSQDRMSIDYGVTGVPETLFINENSHVYTKVVGPLDHDQTTQIVTNMIRQRTHESSPNSKGP